MNNQQTHKILFVLRKSTDYHFSNFNKKSGLFLSANFINSYINNELKNNNIESKVIIVVDSNSIDKEIHDYNPSIVILEALWCPPYKVEELSKLYPNVKFIIRIHSKTPFLSNEGIAMDWIFKYNNIESSNIFISFNDYKTNNDYRNLNIKSIHLPNIYYPNKADDNYKSDVIDKLESIIKDENKYNIINIGCFGAIRPMKNQLTQAISAIQFADNADKRLLFHINATRTEQKGEQALKNIRSLFDNSKHKLVEWDWLNDKDFYTLIKRMNFGMQCSLSESFNIVTADFVSNKIPIIVSNDIEWMPYFLRTNPLSIKKIVNKIRFLRTFRNLCIHASLNALNRYNKKSKKKWKEFITLLSR